MDIPIPVCIAQASATYQIAQEKIAAVIAQGLPAGTVKNYRVGPMAIPTQWLPIFERMGISVHAIVNDPCQNIIAGTWIMAYTMQYPAWQRNQARVHPKYFSTSLKQRRQRLAPMIQQIASQTGTPAALIHAVASVESGYQEHVVSKAGAVGVMQLMPKTAAMLGVNPWRVEENILGGARYLGQLIQQFSGDLRLVLAAYNAGPSAVTKHGYRIPPFSETQAYVPKVLAMYASFSKN